MIQKCQKQVEREEQKKEKKEKLISSFAFPLLAWGIGLMEMRWWLASGENTGRRISVENFHCWVVSRCSDRTWRPLQIAARHFQDAPVEKFPYCIFLWIAADLGLHLNNNSEIHLLIILKGKEVFPRKRDFFPSKFTLHPLLWNACFTFSLLCNQISWRTFT